jgi:hypothetical protein
MGCIFALFGGLFPRLALLILWIARPALVGAAFSAVLLDIGHWSASYTQRNQIPGVR